MSQLLPLSSYGLRVLPGEPVAPIDPEVDFPCSIRITMAAVDPANPIDEEDAPSVLRIIRPAIDIDDEDEEEDPEEEDEDVPTTETVICTLNPKTVPQQPLDIVITLAEDVLFHVTGSYPIHLTGNLLEHPYDQDSSEEDEDEDEDDEEDEDEDELDEEEYDLTPDEDELSGKIQEIVDDEAEEGESESEEEEIDEEELRKLIQAEEKKRAAEEKQPKRKAEAAPTKEAKKPKQEKKVEFSDQLEKQKGASESKYPTKKLDGGVIIEDRTIGTGAGAKRGDVIGMRYVGKLKNGKVFDKNTSGKPFSFKLGVGEVIKGWDVGVLGMKVKGERRIIIPAAMAYGRKGVPGIPGNAELTFDVKLVNIK